MTAQPRQPEPAGLYCHIPFCASKCRYCAFYSEPVSRHTTAELVTAMIAHLRRCDPAQPITTVYIGGGTPTCIPPADLLRLIDAIHNHFRITPDSREFTVEANPHHLTPSLLTGLRDHGVNRLSVGAQSFCDRELALLGRTHTADDITAAVRSARDAGYGNISLDLIFALPGSTLADWQRSLDAVLALAPEHISAYSLAYEPRTPFHRALEAGELTATDEETDRRMYELTIDTLTAAGYDHYEISNFARPHRRCRHNLTYWANDPYIGIGPAAASYYKGIRSTNTPDIPAYISALQQNDLPPQTETHTPTDLETACETAVLNLRRTAGIDLAEYKSRTHHDLRDLFAKEIDHNIRAGLLTLKNKSKNLALTPQALPIADKILTDFATI
ncbi:Oxygen-independent coproporphyrinogen-III oxidase 1 [Anaerohalosphaera lusitana]|uniref:Heme chaperone HemW n=1 Tax=Anaerohalosphaera lusitana TaxID=1936003 RepID=A0A1U9NIL1_9BACT|nr:Oxygen-independent coproporphyrinogen-III oxidase 1 [Anaerohalosphaera lusitana]